MNNMVNKVIVAIARFKVISKIILKARKNLFDNRMNMAIIPIIIAASLEKVKNKIIDTVARKRQILYFNFNVNSLSNNAR